MEIKRDRPEAQHRIDEGVAVGVVREVAAHYLSGTYSTEREGTKLVTFGNTLQNHLKPLLSCTSSS